MMKPWWCRTARLAALTLVISGAELGPSALTPISAQAAPARDATADSRMVAAPGLVEPVGEQRQIASQVIGIIQEMRVDENDHVVAGQIVAVVENSVQRARLASARASLALREAELSRVVSGARDEERREADAALAQADAALDLARRQYQRQLPLAKSGASPQSALDIARSNQNAAEARRAAMAARRALVMAGSRQEDISAARAQVQLAEADVALAEALLDKTFIRSPITGTILRRYRTDGEVVTNAPPTLIVTVGDLSGLRVRAEIDETDIGRVKVGQRAELTADAYPGRKFGGSVIRVSSQLGGKEIQTGRPAERVDTKVLQVLIDLDAGAKLPIGLRVDVFFERETAASPPSPGEE